MNWDAIGAIGEMIGALAVVITLAYLAIQIRYANKQTELESFRHSWDALNQFCDLLSLSTERASIVNRGRQGLSEINDDERIIFEHIHLRMLNTIESWHHQVMETSSPGTYRDLQLENIASIVRLYIDFPGVRELWMGVRHTFVPIQGLVESNLTGQDSVSRGQ